MKTAGLRTVLRALLFAWALFMGNANAQALALLPEAVDAELFECLTRVEGAEGAIAYPESERLAEHGGTVRVRLEFFDRYKGPLVEVLSSPSRELSQAVLSFVNDYRLPCFRKGGQRAFAIQEFVFHPRDARAVTWVAPVAVGPRQDDCKVVGIEKTKLERYPPKALREGAQGKVLALATFEGPGVPAKVTILHGGGHRALDEAVGEALGQVQLECSAPGERWPRRAIQLYTFRIEGGARAALKDLDLKTFVAAIDQLGSHKVRFDLTTMSCPFEVQLVLYQPFARNSVGQVGPPDPNRQALLAWLQSVALRLPPKAMDELLGSTMRISVPCGLLDLTF